MKYVSRIISPNHLPNSSVEVMLVWQIARYRRQNCLEARQQTHLVITDARLVEVLQVTCQVIESIDADVVGLRLERFYDRSTYRGTM